MSVLQLEIVTPEERIFSGNALMVIGPGSEGGLGILPDHMPLMTRVIPGELIITTEEGELSYAVGEGFLDVGRDSVSILSDMVIPESDIDEKAAEEAVAKAEKEMRDRILSGEELALVESSLLRSLAQLHVKRRSRR